MTAGGRGGGGLPPGQDQALQALRRRANAELSKALWWGGAVALLPGLAQIPLTIVEWRLRQGCGRWRGPR